MKKKPKMKSMALSILLTLAMVVGLLPGMSLTAKAADATLLTTITATGENQASYSPENVATVEFTNCKYERGGWTAMSGSIKVNAAKGYTITKCLFYNNNGTVTDDTAPFEMNYSRYSPLTTKVEVYGYAPSAAVDKTALNTAITAAETLYNSIKDVADYSEIAETLQAAIDGAKEVAESETANQDAVDVATTDITTAKTNAEAAKKDVDDTTEANKVSDKISDLPSKEAVTKNDKTAIDAAKAAFDALTDDQKEKVSDADKQKLNDAVEALAAIEKEEADTAAAKAVSDKIADLPAKDQITKEDKAAIDAAKAAFDALTDDQKAKVSDADKQKLNDAVAAIEAIEKDEADAAEAKKAADAINALPASDKVTTGDKAAIEAARKAYDALTADQKAKVSADTLKKLTDDEAALKEAEMKAVATITVNTKTVNAKKLNAAVAKAGGSNEYVTTIVLGKKVKKISKSTFKNYPNAKTLVVKTKKLKRASVKKALKGSKITKVQVKVSSKKKINKKYVRKYKKIFTKKNAGKKVKVSR